MLQKPGALAQNNMRSRNRLIIAVLLTASLTASTAALGQAQLDRKTQLSVGGFVTDQDTTARFKASTGGGATLNFERDLGLDSSQNVFRFDGFSRFGTRHRIDGSVFSFSRDGTAIITGDIEWQDSTFPVSANVKTDLDLAVYKLAYGYELVQRQDRYLAASFGLYTADLDIKLRNVDGDGVEDGDFTAPLPVLGLRGAYAASDRWTFYASAEYFVASIDDIDGSILDLSASVDYWFSNRFAVGLGYNYLEIKADGRNKSIRADVEWDISGALLSIKFGF